MKTSATASASRIYDVLQREGEVSIILAHNGLKKVRYMVSMAKRNSQRKSNRDP